MLTKNSKDVLFLKCHQVSIKSIEDAEMIVASFLLEVRYMAEGSQEEQVAYEATKRTAKLLRQARQELENLRG